MLRDTCEKVFSNLVDQEKDLPIVIGRSISDDELLLRLQIHKKHQMRWSTSF